MNKRLILWFLFRGQSLLCMLLMLLIQCFIRAQIVQCGFHFSHTHACTHKYTLAFYQPYPNVIWNQTLVNATYTNQYTPMLQIFCKGQVPHILVLLITEWALQCEANWWVERERGPFKPTRGTHITNLIPINIAHVRQIPKWVTITKSQTNWIEATGLAQHINDHLSAFVSI